MATGSPPSRTSSVTIMGGGVVGCFLAYCLALAGMPVTVIERERIGAGATGASAGNVQAVTGPCGPLEAVFGAESLRRWRHYLPAIKEESGIDTLDLSGFGPDLDNVGSVINLAPGGVQFFH